MTDGVDTHVNYISDAIEDQHGRRYLQFGCDDRHIWLPFGDLNMMSQRTVERLAHAGVPALTNKAKEALKTAAQTRTQYRDATIASNPGWVGDSYVLPDTRVITRRRRDSPIVAFEPDKRFSRSSSTANWQEALTRIVPGQPLLHFLQAFALAGPLLHYAPPDMQNPMIELVGDTHVGKSTLAKLMTSIWGGCSDSLSGICGSWDYTPAQLDGLRNECRDNLLVLNEAALAGDDDRARAKVIGAAVMKLADTGSRRRFGEDAVPPIRQAVLSTSNIPMLKLIGNSTKTHDAIVSRVLTLKCDRGFGILDSVPTGFQTAEEAVVTMDRVASAHYGSVGAAFLRRLQNYSNGSIRRAIEEGMRQAEFCNANIGAFGPRQTKTIAITYAVGRLAHQLNILPDEWGTMKSALQALFPPNVLPPSTPDVLSSVEVMQAYLTAHRDALREPTDSLLPMVGADFDLMPGVWFAAERRLVVSTKFLRCNLPNAERVLRDLKEEGRLSHDKDVFSKKAPRQVAVAGRAHFIDLAARPTMSAS